MLWWILQELVILPGGCLTGGAIFRSI